MNKITCCKNCDLRHKNCHSDCQIYLKEKAEYERFKEHTHQEKVYHNQIMKTMYERGFPKGKLKRGYF